MASKGMKRALLILVMLVAVMVAGPRARAAVVVSDVDGLVSAVSQAAQGGDTEILLADGTYTLDNMLWVEANGLTVRSQSGDRDAVIIQGQGMTGGVSHIFNVAGTDFTVRDMTLRLVANHAVQLQPSATGATIQNLVIQDTGEQMIKGSWDSNDPDTAADNGRVEGCLFQYTAGIGPQYYIGGIDVHRARNWVVRSNTFMYIRSPEEDLAEYAIHFWSNAENTLVERNTIINCDRGIGFGLGDRGHQGGIIRNNAIYHDGSDGHHDVGICLESAQDAQVYNNTIYLRHDYPNAIEYRYAETTGLYIANNLTNRAITSRDGGSATVTTNVTDAQEGWFRNLEAADLYPAYAVPEVVDRGLAIEGLVDDHDGRDRPQGAGYDIGAYEYVEEEG